MGHEATSLADAADASAGDCDTSGGGGSGNGADGIPNSGGMLPATIRQRSPRGNSMSVARGRPRSFSRSLRSNTKPWVFLKVELCFSGGKRQKWRFLRAPISFLRMGVRYPWASHLE